MSVSPRIYGCRRASYHRMSDVLQWQSACVRTTSVLRYASSMDGVRLKIHTVRCLMLIACMNRRLLWINIPQSVLHRQRHHRKPQKASLWPTTQEMSDFYFQSLTREAFVCACPCGLDRPIIYSPRVGQRRDSEKEQLNIMPGSAHNRSM